MCYLKEGQSEFLKEHCKARTFSEISHREGLIGIRLEREDPLLLEECCPFLLETTLEREYQSLAMNAPVAQGADPSPRHSLKGHCQAETEQFSGVLMVCSLWGSFVCAPLFVVVMLRVRCHFAVRVDCLLL